MRRGNDRTMMMIRPVVGGSGVAVVMVEGGRRGVRVKSMPVWLSRDGFEPVASRK